MVLLVRGTASVCPPDVRQEQNRSQAQADVERLAADWDTGHGMVWVGKDA